MSELAQLTIEQLLSKVRDEFGRLHIAGEPIARLELLEAYRKTHPVDLSKVDVLYVQHHLAPFYARVLAMEDQGLERRRSWFLDIPYSTNKQVRALLDNGQMASPLENPFTPYSCEQRRRMRDLMQDIASSRSRADILVIDDGAYFLRELSRQDTPPRIREYFRAAKVIEQTTRGHRFLESAEGHRTIQELDIVAVSVARTATKMRLEAPAIGEAVGRAVAHAIGAAKAIDSDFHPRQALIIGFGSVGAASLWTLQAQIPSLLFSVVESNEDRQTIAKNRGASTFAAMPHAGDVAGRFDIVLGCTGGTSFTWEHRQLLSSVAVLASGSSAAVELDRERLVEMANRDDNDDFYILNNQQKDSTNLHVPIRFQYLENRHQKRFTVLNGGFPVNFDSKLEHIPTVLIAPTHCLLYAAVVQAISETQPGLYMLRPETDYWILDKAAQMLQLELFLGGVPS